MGKRTTMKDLQNAADCINRILEEYGHDFRVIIDHAYGQPRPFRQRVGSTGTWDLGPRLPMGQCLDWLWAYHAGLRLGTEIAPLPEGPRQTIESELWMAYDAASDNGDEDTPNHIRQLAEAAQAVGRQDWATEWNAMADLMEHETVRPEELQIGDVVQYIGRRQVVAIDRDHDTVSMQQIDPPQEMATVDLASNVLIYLLERDGVEINPDEEPDHD